MVMTASGRTLKRPKLEETLKRYQKRIGKLKRRLEHQKLEILRLRLERPHIMTKEEERHVARIIHLATRLSKRLRE